MEAQSEPMVAEAHRPGHVYLLREYEPDACTLSAAIKVGRSENITSRVKQYPRGSRLLLAMWTDSCVVAEQLAIEGLHAAGVHRADKGSEYFEVPEPQAVDIVLRAVAEANTISAACATNGDTHPAPTEYMEPAMVVLEFVHEHKARLSGQTMEARELYAQVLQFVKMRRVLARVGFGTLRDELKRSYGVECGPSVDAAGQEIACSFTFPKLVSSSGAAGGADSDADAGPMTESSLGSAECLYANDMERIEAFCKAHLVPSEGDHFTLKAAKEAFSKSRWFNGKVGSLKEGLERALGTVCLQQKKIRNRNVPNVFMGYALGACNPTL